MGEPRTVDGFQPQRSQRVDQGAVAPLSRLALTPLEAEELFAAGTPAHLAEVHPSQPVSMQWSDSELDGLGRNGPPVAVAPAVYLVDRGGRLTFEERPTAETGKQGTGKPWQALTALEAEEFFTTGTQAHPAASRGRQPISMQWSDAELDRLERPSASAAESVSEGPALAAAIADPAQDVFCCAGEDVPEAGGFRHSKDCSNRRTAAAIIDRLIDAPGPFVDAFARIKRRDIAIARLMAAGRELARSAIRRRRAYDPTVRAVRPVAGCLECGNGCIGDGAIVHRRRCHVGQVLNALEDLAGIAVELAALDAAGAVDQADGCGGITETGGAA